jgi:hypothetical protein
MTEFLKNNINIKDFIWLLIILIPMSIAWTNIEKEQSQQRSEIEEMKLQQRESRNEVNDKFDKILIEITDVKIELQRKKNIENQ